MIETCGGDRDEPDLDKHSFYPCVPSDWIDRVDNGMVTYTGGGYLNPESSDLDSYDSDEDEGPAPRNEFEKSGKYLRLNPPPGKGPKPKKKPEENRDVKTSKKKSSRFRSIRSIRDDLLEKYCFLCEFGTDERKSRKTSENKIWMASRLLDYAPPILNFVDLIPLLLVLIGGGTVLKDFKSDKFDKFIELTFWKLLRKLVPLLIGPYFMPYDAWLLYKQVTKKR